MSSDSDSEFVSANDDSDSVSSVVTERATSKKWQSTVAQRRVAWSCFCCCESVFIAFFGAFLGATIAPVSYSWIVGLLVGVSPFLWLWRCHVDDACRKGALLIGSTVAVVNAVLILVLLVAWWHPYADGLRLLPELCVVGLGHVDVTSARIVVRCPRANRARAVAWPTNVTAEPLLVTSDWIDLQSAVGFSVALQLQGLEGGTQFDFRVDFDALVGDAPSTGSFRTAPPLDSPDARKFRFTFGSCLLQAGFRNLDRVSEIREQNSRFLLFLGDYVYLDQPQVELGFSQSEVEARYARVLGDPVIRDARRHLPTLYMYDDHEIVNDWDRGESAPYATAIHDVWHNWLGVGNPAKPGAYFFSFRFGDACFFVLDVRRYRDAKAIDANDPNKTMLGSRQLADLKAWLLTSNSECVAKFIATPVPFTTLMSSKDSWAGFLVERQAILDFIASQNITGVVFLSGDSHTAAAVEMTVDSSTSVHEFSASPIDGFWLPVSFLRNSTDDQKVLGKFAGSDHWGTVDVDTTDDRFGRITVHIDAGANNRVFSKTLEFPRRSQRVQNA